MTIRSNIVTVTLAIFCLTTLRNLAPGAPSITWWSKVAERPMTSTKSIPPSLLRTGLSVIASTPKMATWGGLITGVKDSTPSPPRLLTVKVASTMSSAPSVPSTACVASALIRPDNSATLSSSLRLDHGDDQSARRVAGEAQVDVSTLVQPSFDQLRIDRRDLEHSLDRAERHEVVDRDVRGAGRGLDLAAERQQPGGVGRGMQRVLRGARQRLPHAPGDPLAHGRETDRWRHEIARADHAAHSRARTPDLVAAVDQAASGAADRRRGAQLGANVPLQDAPIRARCRAPSAVGSRVRRQTAAPAGSCARRARAMFCRRHCRLGRRPRSVRSRDGTRQVGPSIGCR